jgi:hypothetical protein
VLWFGSRFGWLVKVMVRVRARLGLGLGLGLGLWLGWVRARVD